MHVGFVVYDSLEETSGGYRYDRKLVEHLERAGDTVDVITIPRRSYPHNLIHSFSRSLRNRLNQPFDVLLQDELCYPSLVRHTRELEEPTAVVSLVHLLDTVAKDGPSQALYRAIERRYLSRIDGVLCTSRHTQRQVDSLVDVPSAVAYPGGRQEGAALSPETVATRARDGGLQVLFLGTLVERKGLSTLIDALAALGGEWSATVVGRTDADPTYVQTIKNRVEDTIHPERFKIRGPVSDTELERILERSHVLAVPSHYESFGMAYLEAMEYGVVPLATTVGGPPEFIDDGTTGILVEPGDAERLREVLSTLESDREYLAKLGSNALAAADEHPTWEGSMARARAFLRDCIEREGEQS